jgi:hypothetical protein
MGVLIIPENQIERINRLIAEVEDWKQVQTEQFVHRPSNKSWSPIEVMKHMIIAHEAYEYKINGILESQSAQSETNDQIIAGFIPSFLIRRFPPKKDGSIHWKMKTMKQFEPLLVIEDLAESDVVSIMDHLLSCLKELKYWVEDYRKKRVIQKKMNSAIGPLVRFNVPEACEFILCHNERHFQQIKNDLKTLKSENKPA